jgi:hypothetical protein
MERSDIRGHRRADDLPRIPLRSIRLPPARNCNSAKRIPSLKNLIPALRTGLIFPASRSSEGAFMRRREGGAGCGARGPVSHTGTREARVTVRPHYGGLPFGGLDGAGRRRRKPPDQAPRRGRPRPGSYGPGAQNRRDGAPGGARSREHVCADCVNLSAARAPRSKPARAASGTLRTERRSALHPSGFPRGRKSEQGSAAPSKSAGDPVWLFDNRTGANGDEVISLARRHSGAGRKPEPGIQVPLHNRLWIPDNRAFGAVSEMTAERAARQPYR